MIVELVLALLFLGIAIGLGIGWALFRDSGEGDTEEQEETVEESESEDEEEEMNESEDESDEEAEPKTEFKLDLDNETSLSNTLTVTTKDGEEYVLNFRERYGRGIKIMLYEEENIITDEEDVYFFFDIYPAGCPTPATEGCMAFLTLVYQGYYEVGGIWKLDVETGEFSHLFKVDGFQSENTSAPKIEVISKGTSFFWFEVSQSVNDANDSYKIVKAYSCDTDTDEIERELI